jgi:hypothetical protein
MRLRLHILRFIARTALVLCAGLAAVSGAAAQSEYTGTLDAFFVPPSPLPSSVPGTILRWQRYTPSVLLDGLTFGVDSYRVMYVSKDAKNTPIAVTGSVFVPKLPFLKNLWPAPRPIIALGTGTQGMADKCAPSRGFANSTEYDIIYARAALGEGWAVAVSDYQGLGTPGEHPYVVGRSLGKSVIDSVRALRKLDALFDANLFLPDLMSIEGGSKVAVWGYSEGGNSAAWAGQLLGEGYGSVDAALGAPSVTVVGVAAGGIPSNIPRVGEAINRPNSLQNIAFGVLIAAGIGFDAAYPELNLAARLTPQGKDVVKSVRDTCVVEHVLGNIGQSDITRYTLNGFNPLTDPAWLARFNENSLDKQTVYPKSIPFYLDHGVLDEAVEYTQGRDLARFWCAKGVPVRWGAFLGDHIATYPFALPDAMTFLRERFDGTAFTSTACGSIGP